ncbi:hypothetical protein IGS68_11155 [Skermanella sp. TT6]|uniref:Uncharacterized protein n=1 Tax=Skermanella cutis TaxID=2775420 RepID=A0ABX7BC73_9PROT|nr:hypothetical protein [Skermanella sp. TT6]QQP91718.1 hypothetical protein IGS68_11155 [Skermanella sp. TT6]
MIAVGGMAPGSRLLPASIPFRFLAAALLFHLVGWTALAAAAPVLAGASGGLGLEVAGLHLMTLGVLTAAAMGAGFQLLPVAIQADLPAVWPCRLASWLLLPGVAALAWGMATGDLPLLGIGGSAVALALAVFAVVVGMALRRADCSRPQIRPVVRHLWAALACVAALAALGLTLLGDFAHGYLDDHRTVAAIHLAVACYGFLGLLAAGFVQVLVPMFALVGPPPESRVNLVLGLAVAGLLLAGAGSFAAAAVVGLGAACLHVHGMAGLMRRRTRRDLGSSFLLIRLSWVLLPASLVLGLLLALDLLPAWGPALFALTLVGGWLLSLVLGMLQRILPFLAAIHAARAGRRIPKVSELGAGPILYVQAALHGAALAGVGAGIVLNLEGAIRAGALAGAAGAGAFIIYAIDLYLRIGDLPPARAAAPIARTSSGKAGP